MQRHLQAQADLEALRASGSQQQPQQHQPSSLDPSSEAAALQARTLAKNVALCACLLSPATASLKEPCAQGRVTQLAVSALSSFISRVAATAYNMAPASAQMGTAATLQVTVPPFVTTWRGNEACKPRLPESAVATDCILGIQPYCHWLDVCGHQNPCISLMSWLRSSACLITKSSQCTAAVLLCHILAADPAYSLLGAGHISDLQQAPCRSS